VHRPTRPEAIATMRRALREFGVEGIQTTIPLHQDLLTTDVFASGTVDTTYIERVFMPARKAN
jgi:acetyl-CoA carboxylase biotin carboxylase subunit